MARPLPDEIINRITSLINDKTTPKELRDAKLKAVAREAWVILFPEEFDRDEPYPAVEERMRQRLHNLRTQLASNPNQDKIIRVIESQASGEGFYWLDQ